MCPAIQSPQTIKWASDVAPKAKAKPRLGEQLEPHFPQQSFRSATNNDPPRGYQHRQLLSRVAQDAKTEKMLPEPSFTLTIPSIHDGTALDCRVYHPDSFYTEGAAPWKRHAVVFAHPYAPMGGSFDDPLMDTAAELLLRKGYLLGTFNFRGAGRSAGRTSWTAKPECGDYTSFVGFMAHYLHRLDPFGHRIAEPPVLMMAGYSYGAMITTQLPPLDQVLEPFSSPDCGSHAAQIRLRAESWAQRQTQAVQEARAAMARGQQKASPTSSSEKSSSPPVAATPAKGKLSPASGFVMPRPAYLLLSPLQGLITHLATMSLVPSVFARQKPRQEDEAEAKLVRNPTLAVFGDNDIFVPVGKLRAWAGRLSSQPGSQFQGYEIGSAGHFWAEEGVLDTMLDLVCEFAGKLYDGN